MNQLKYMRIAEKLNKELKADLLKHKLHFRGNLKSFSLVSLSKKHPEIGISGLKTEATGRKRCFELMGKANYTKKVLPQNKRVTREKELQAWIILNALKNDGKLAFDANISFLTSELALYLNKKRVVNDLLGLDKDGTLVVIELKSDRAKKRLIEQINRFENVIEQNTELFNALVEMLGQGSLWNGKTRGVLVWPDNERAKPINWPAGIHEFTYREIETAKGKAIWYNNNKEIIFIKK